jgi:hypothetical protein
MFAEIALTHVIECTHDQIEPLHPLDIVFGFFDISVSRFDIDLPASTATPPVDPGPSILEFSEGPGPGLN